MSIMIVYSIIAQTNPTSQALSLYQGINLYNINRKQSLSMHIALVKSYNKVYLNKEKTLCKETANKMLKEKMTWQILKFLK